ncbi:formylglycine-generating enzyme family protein [soil metagenome]
MIISGRVVFICGAVLFGAVALAAGPKPEMALVPAGKFEVFEKTQKKNALGVLSDTRKIVDVPSLWLDRHVVTNDDFLGFVRQHPEWQKGQVKSIFSDSHYLQAWTSDLGFPEGAGKRPVTQVSWFAAKAYCESFGKSLPTTDQWEYALYDKGRNIDAVKRNILNWYSQTNSSSSKNDQSAEANGFGVSDLGVLVWEWTEDFDSFLSATDSRDGGKDSKLFCGSGSQLGDASDYATFMRYSFRSSLKANYTTSNLGFRCAKENK